MHYSILWTLFIISYIFGLKNDSDIDIYCRSEVHECSVIFWITGPPTADTLYPLYEAKYHESFEQKFWPHPIILLKYTRISLFIFNACFFIIFMYVNIFVQKTFKII